MRFVDRMRILIVFAAKLKFYTDINVKKKAQLSLTNPRDAL